MALVSISKAAKLAGISRQWLYDEYMDKGTISVNRTNPKRPKIDTAELMRVFGSLQDDSANDDNSLHQLTQEKSVVYSDVLNGTVKELTGRISMLEVEKAAASKEVELLRDQISDLRTDRDEWRDQAKKQTLLLTVAQEATQEQAKNSTRISWWWPFGRKTA